MDSLSLIDAVRPHVEAIACRIAKAAGADADDLVQAGLLKVWQERSKLLAAPDPAAIARLCGAVAVYRACRSARRQLRLFHTVPTTDGGFHPTDLVASREPEPTVDEFDTIIGLLAEPHRRLLAGRFRDRRSVDWLAAAAGMTRPAVSDTLNRLIARLRHRLEHG